MARDERKDPLSPKTLTDDDVVGAPKEVGRRGAVSLLGVGAAASAVALATGCRRRERVTRVTVQPQQGQPYTGITDSDGGQYADPANYGHGSGPQYTGITDSDGGQYADPANYGRGVQVQTTGVTDSDGGACADPAGNGRGYSGCTDADGGACADPGGRGRC